MARKSRPRLRRLVDVLAQTHPTLEDPAGTVLAGRVTVAGVLATNPARLVRRDAVVTLVGPVQLRGESKLAAALSGFGVRVEERVALDLGAAAGGFTRALLGAGAARVYAVDAGYGQLLGSLRQDSRVVNLERTNVGRLDRGLVRDEIGIVTADLTYLPLAEAIRQVTSRLQFGDDADLVGLVKPQFELRLSEPPTDRRTLMEAVDAAVRGIEAAGWRVGRTMESPARGARGSIEFFVHASWSQDSGVRGRR